MPLTPLQHRILATISSRRSPDSYVAGETVLQRRGIRLSKDIDIFHDHEKVEAIARGDAAALEEAHLTVRWEIEGGTFFRGTVGDGEFETRVEWVSDSDFRFFPTISDPEFGYVLHPIDLATNKIAAAASRFVPRDAIDLIWIDRNIQPLGAIAWAAVEKDPGWMPEGLLQEVKAKARYQDYHLREVDLLEPMSAADLNRTLRDITSRAERLVASLPKNLEFGALLRADGSLAQPDPDDPASLEGLVVHHGSRKGCWPSSPEIGSVMLREGHYPGA